MSTADRLGDVLWKSDSGRGCALDRVTVDRTAPGLGGVERLTVDGLFWEGAGGGRCGDGLGGQWWVMRGDGLWVARSGGLRVVVPGGGK